VDAGDLTIGSTSIWEIVGVVTALVGVLVGAWIAIPSGTRLLPASLVTSGVVLYLAGSGLVTTRDTWQMVSGFIAAAVGLALLSSVRLEEAPTADPVQTARAIFLPRRVQLAGHKLPSHQRVMAYGTAFQLDMQGTTARSEAVLELSMTAILGRVDVIVPEHWLILPGRLHVSSGSHMRGTFDHTRPIPYLGTTERDDIRDLVAERTDANSPKAPPFPVVLNVTVFGSHVQIIRAM
jgi:hypothetical protein